MWREQQPIETHQAWKERGKFMHASRALCHFNDGMTFHRWCAPARLCCRCAISKMPPMAAIMNTRFSVVHRFKKAMSLGCANPDTIASL